MVQIFREHRSNRHCAVVAFQRLDNGDFIHFFSRQRGDAELTPGHVLWDALTNQGNELEALGYVQSLTTSIAIRRAGFFESTWRSLCRDYALHVAGRVRIIALTEVAPPKVEKFRNEVDADGVHDTVTRLAGLIRSKSGDSS